MGNDKKLEGRMTAWRHAYCIIAHNEPELLRILVSLIDDERNDIFLMLDEKADDSILDGVRVERSGFFMAPRVSVHWGAMSLVRAEYSVLKAAHEHGPYAYYHLISGVDLPLHGQNWIHDYCDRHQGDEFIGFLPVREYEFHCTRYHHFFLEFMRLKNPIVRKFFSLIRHAVVAIEHGVGYSRNLPYPVRKGANWFSLTESAVSYLIEKECVVWKSLNHIHTADEIVFHMILASSPFMEKVHVPGKNGHSNMRLIDWKRGSPYVWKMTDLQDLLSSNRFFARKFSSAHMDVVSAVAEHVQNEQNGRIDRPGVIISA